MTAIRHVALLLLMSVGFSSQSMVAHCNTAPQTSPLCTQILSSRGVIDSSWSDSLQSGDLLFVSDTDGMGQAIKESTGRYTHVALVERSGSRVYVIDATPRLGVARRLIDVFLKTERPVVVYRLTIPFDTVTVIARAKSLVGRPYDNAFLPDNDAFYCSELIQTAFGNLFPSKPMNWRDADGNLPEYWVAHFQRIGIPIPEGVPGTNPTDLSQSPLLKKSTQQ